MSCSAGCGGDRQRWAAKKARRRWAHSSSRTPPTTSTGGTTADDSTTGPGTSEGTDTTTGGALEACEAYAAYRLKCDPEAAGTEAELLAYCTMIRNLVEATYGPTCRAGSYRSSRR